MTFCDSALPDQGEEVSVKDDRSVFPHFGHLLHQLLLLPWPKHLAGLAIASLLFVTWISWDGKKADRIPPVVW